ncbi:ankyrin repeat-containing domain protein, partial [Tuber indicum]
LNQAIWRNNEMVLRTLLDSGMSANASDETGTPPLIQAVLAKRPKMIQLLLSKEEYGIDVNKSIGFCGTPLQAAIRSGDIEIVSMLLKHSKINVNPTTSHFALSVLNATIKNKNIDILTLLLSDPRVDINLASGGNMETPLTYALSGQNVNIVQLLLQHPRLDVNA